MRNGVPRPTRLGRQALVIAAAGLLVSACGSTVPAGILGERPAATAPESADGALSMQTPGTELAGRTGASSSRGVASAGIGAAPMPPATSSLPPPPTSVDQGAGLPGKRAAALTVGFLYAVNDGAAPAGINNGNSITPSQVMRALVDSWNRSGGLGGRRIDPVYAELHSYNSNYEQQIAAACATFTQDHHVAAVLMQSQYYSDQLLSCLSHADVPLISADFDAPDALDAQRYPLYLTPLALIGDAREKTTVAHLSATGFLTAHSRVGVIVEGCPVDQRVYKDALMPALRQAGVALASTFQAQCFQSLQDFGAQTSQMPSAVLQFRRDGVTCVLVVSQAAEANIVYAFSEVAEGQGYRPYYGLTSVAAPTALALNAPTNQMRKMRGIGWLPLNDSAVPSQTGTTATGRSCLRRLRAEGVRPTSGTDLFFAYSACDAFGLSDVLLRATRGDTDPRALLAALPRVTTAYVAATTIGGKLAVRNGHPAPALGRIFAYTAGTGFHYVSAPFQL